MLRRFRKIVWYVDPKHKNNFEITTFESQDFDCDLDIENITLLVCFHLSPNCRGILQNQKLMSHLFRFPVCIVSIGYLK